MAKTDERVMALVENELKKNPEVSVEELYGKARGVNSGIGKLTRRQFHARYPLQVKRRSQRNAGGAKGRKVRRTRKSVGRGRKGTGATSEVNRQAIRDALIRFATDVAGADEKRDLIKALTGVDRYVDQVVKAVGR